MRHGRMGPGTEGAGRREVRPQMGPYKVKVRLRFLEDEKTGAGEFCSGVAQLLQGVEEMGSLKRCQGDV
jgi:hypothetical protein